MLKMLQQLDLCFENLIYLKFLVFVIVHYISLWYFRMLLIQRATNSKTTVYADRC